MTLFDPRGEAESSEPLLGGKTSETPAGPEANFLSATRMGAPLGGHSAFSLPVGVAMGEWSHGRRESY